MIELQAEYIKEHISDPTIHVEVEVLVGEDYDPETDGFHCNIVSTSFPLSLPMDNSGADSTSRLGHDLGEAIDSYKLIPGTRYRITMVRCLECDGWPHMMETWAVQEVCMSDLYEPEIQPPSPAIDDVLEMIEALITQHEGMEGSRGVGAIMALTVLRNQITGDAVPQHSGCDSPAHQQPRGCEEGRCQKFDAGAQRTCPRGRCEQRTTYAT